MRNGLPDFITTEPSVPQSAIFQVRRPVYHRSSFITNQPSVPAFKLSKISGQEGRFTPAQVVLSSTPDVVFNLKLNPQKDTEK
jgi:hypothetical protein